MAGEVHSGPIAEYNGIDANKVLNKTGLLELSSQIKGYINTNMPQPYTLPTASTSTLGGVKVDGETITIANGVISAVGGSGGSEFVLGQGLQFEEIEGANTLSINPETVAFRQMDDENGNTMIISPEDITLENNNEDVKSVVYMSAGMLGAEYNEVNINTGETYVPHTIIITPMEITFGTSDGEEEEYTGNLSIDGEDLTWNGVKVIATNDAVATEDYVDSAIANIPSSGSGFSGDYNDLTNKPTLFSGNYNDLTNKPTIPSAYTLPTATTSTLGGVKVDGSTITISNGIISAPGSLPTAPTTDGTYMLKCVVSSGTPTYSWEQITVGGSY